ncbi:MAG: TRAM domain-containing protein, partial [Deltaproteobacteria bacterium]|nr:TRAM domain-containing protein [Deltaproteobacteria bacterium]
GHIVANLLTYPLVLNFLDDKYLEFAAYLFANSVIGYVGLSIGMKKGDEFAGVGAFNVIRENNELLKGRKFDEKATPDARDLIVDTSVIIDGRISEVCETGFLEGGFIVPQFVLQELQYVADSSDGVKRARGKRGFDTLKQMRENKKIKVVVSDRDFPDIKEVDAKLVAMAKETGGKILTNDSNLDKVAELQGVDVLNINRLATALKPVVLPGEVMTIPVMKEGKEQGQGIGYLDDGTMVVIDNARGYVGKTVDVSITSVLQTAGGRMIFSKVKEDFKENVKRALYQ